MFDLNVAILIYSSHARLAFHMCLRYLPQPMFTFPTRHTIDSSYHSGSSNPLSQSFLFFFFLYSFLFFCLLLNAKFGVDLASIETWLDPQTPSCPFSHDPLSHPCPTLSHCVYVYKLVCGAARAPRGVSGPSSSCLRIYIRITKRSFKFISYGFHLPEIMHNMSQTLS